MLAGCNAGCSGPDVIAWLTGNVELNIREATALEGHSREAIHLAAEVIADVTEPRPRPGWAVRRLRGR